MLSFLIAELLVTANGTEMISCVPSRMADLGEKSVMRDWTLLPGFWAAHGACAYGSDTPYPGCISEVHQRSVEPGTHPC